MSYYDEVSSVSFGEAISLYFHNYFTFGTRSRRSEYWKAQLFLILASLAISLLTGLVPMLGFVALLWSLATIFPSLSLQIRRLHDVGKSGWWYLFPSAATVLATVLTYADILAAARGASSDAVSLLMLIWLLPLAAGILMFVWMCTDSQEDNQWGPNPKRPSRKRIPSHGEIVADAPPAPPVAPVAPQEIHRTVYNPLETVAPTNFSEAPPVIKPAGKPAVLTVCTGPLAGAIYLCEAGQSITIGRSSSCDVSLNRYPSVSGRHCQITAGDRYVILRDQNSTNGTVVNGKRLPPNQPVKLPDGASFCLGNASCTIKVRFQ